MKPLALARALGLAKRYKIKIAGCAVAKTPAQAVKAAARLGFPVVLKIISQDVVHKTEIGGVITGVSQQEVAAAFEKIRKNAARRRLRFGGVLVQKQLEGQEVIIGGKKDAQFGAVVVFGLGGIFVEVLKDVSMRIAPVTMKEALEMMRETRGFAVLAGARGRKPANLEKIAGMIVACSKLVSNDKKVLEIDLNPVMVNDKDCAAADVRILV